MTVDDDETVGIELSKSSLNPSEGGDEGYTVRLASEPSATVTVTIGGTSGTDLTLSTSSLTFTTSNWSAAQPVTVSAGQDEDAVDDTATLTHTASGGDYASVTRDLPVTVDDDETVGIELSKPSLNPSEGGDEGYTVRLASEPSATVTVTIGGTSGTDLTLSTSSLTFTTSNWSTPQPVTVSAGQDDDAVDDTATLTHTASGGDYASVTRDLPVTVDDDEKVGIELSKPSLNPSEGGDEGYTVRLASEPSATVTVTIGGTSGTDLTLSTSSLTFTTSNWSAAQPVTVSAGQDEDAVDDTATLTHTASGGDYASVTRDLPVRTADDDSTAERVLLMVEPSEVNEGDGPTRMRLTATFDGSVRSEDTVVTVTVTDGTTSPEDCLPVPEFTVTIPARQVSGTATFMVTPVDDALAEDAETLVVRGIVGAEDLGVTSTEITIRDNDESNRPPVFAESYAFSLPEQQDGRRRPVALGTVEARDPDDDPLEYGLVSGDSSRFAVGLRSGEVAYVGPGEDFEAGPSRFELTVAASDVQGQASVPVVVTVTDVAEAPEAVDDAVELSRDTPTVIDVLANDRDPDGDRLRVASVTTPRQGTAAVAGGGVRYVPRPGYHGEDRFRYTVADPGGLTATAAVRVTVLANRPPQAVDDEAETLEDVPVVVDVLANDTDADGDPLRVVSAGPADRGAAAVVAGRVRYSPASDWHGTTRFSYMVADPWGLTSTAAVTVTVLPVNDAPRAVGVIPHQSIEEGGASVTVDLTPYFDDPDGDSLAYDAESSDERAAAVTVAGATLTLVPVVAAAATVTVTASDPEGLTAAQTFGVTVGDQLVRGLLTDTLAAFSRAHLSSARLAIGRHLETGGGGPTRLMVAGRQLSLDAWREMGAGGLEQAHELLFRAATLRQRGGGGGPAGAAAAAPWSPRRGAARFMDGGLGGREQLLLGTDVLLSFGGNDRPMGAGGRGRWTFWVQGDRQWFRGSPAQSAGYDGDLRTGYLGVDVQPSERFLAGVAVSRSGGGGSWEVGSSSGLLATELTVLHPYARWGDRDTAVWALAGLGWGTARNSRDSSGGIGQSPLGLGLGLVEGRQRLMATAGGLDVHLRGEASWARLRTGDGEETVDRLEAAVRRLRAGVEVALSMGDPESLTVAPFGAVSTRHDGGAGQTGVGLELAGGVQLRRGRVRIDAQGRTLALHSATSYEERGFSVMASIGRGGYEPGLTASLRPHWGAAGYGAEALWQDHVQSHSRREDRPDRGVDARIGYGLRLPGDRLLTAFGGYGRMREANRLQAGASVGIPGVFNGDPTRPVQLEFMGERFHRLGAADYRFTVYGIFHFGRGR